MENTFEKADELTKNIKEYVNTRITLVKLEIAEKTSSLIGRFIALFFVLFFFSAAWIFLNAALGFYFSDLLQSRVMGFVIISGINIFIACIIWLTKDRLIRIPVMNAIIKLFYPNEESN